MIKSTITSKNQTTVPKRVREQLGAEPGDLLIWELDGQTAHVRVTEPRFLRRRGSIKVGPGSIADDLRQARKLRGSEGEGRS